jgi:hypothetical protein
MNNEWTLEPHINFRVDIIGSIDKENIFLYLVLYSEPSDIQKWWFGIKIKFYFFYFLPFLFFFLYFIPPSSTSSSL